MAQREKRISLRVNEEEFKQLEMSAINSGYGRAKQSHVSSFVRDVALGHNPPSTFDQKVIVKLCRLHGLLGKAGGLFKLALTKEENIELRAYAIDILKAQREIRDYIRELRVKH